MKINYSNGEVGDTDTMNDLTAEIHERMQDLMVFALKHNLLFYCRVRDPMIKDYTGACNFGQDAEIFTNFVFRVVTDLEDWTDSKVVLAPKEERGEDHV
jgi:hypothetical protein